MRFWARSDPKKYAEFSHHPSKVMMFAAIHKIKGIIFGVFDTNVNQHTYCEMLQENIIPIIKSKRSNPDDVKEDVWMQDGAPVHTTELSLSFLYSHFEFIISNKASEAELWWPASSPDLNVCDNWLWSYLKTKIFEKGPIKSAAELKQKITDQVDSLNNTEEGRGMIDRSCSTFIRKVGLCADNEGSHFEE